jgi:hypothetical protein
MLGLVLLAFADAATLENKVSPVQKVIQLLDDLKGKVAGELAAEEALMSEHSKWCDAQKNEREDAITMAGRTIEDLEATIQDTSAASSAFQTEIEGLATKISSADSDLQVATKIRKEEHEEFEASEKELTDTVDVLERALVVLKRGQNFLQAKGKDTGKGKDKSVEKAKKSEQGFKVLSAALSHIVAATWIDWATKAKVQALVQQADEDTDEDLDLSPQATVAAYESKGSGILDMLGDLQSKAETALSKTRKTEMEAEHAFQMLKMGLENELKTMQSRLSECQIGKTSNDEQQHAASEELAETQTGLAADKKYLAELTQSCAQKVEEFDERQKEAAEEVKAIEKAREILDGGVKSFIQKNVGTGVQDSARQRISALLRGIAQKDGVFALSQLAAQVMTDPFGKVRGMIEAMIDRLLAEAGEEADAKVFCDTELSKSREKQKELAARIDMHQVRIEKAAAGKAKLQSQIKELGAEVAKIDAGTAESISIRQKEKAEYESTTAEYKQSADAVANAIQVLQDYYSQAGFAQVSQPEFGGAKTDIASTIISMLEVAESDFTRLLADAETSEKAAATSFEKLSHDNAVAKSAKQADTTAKTSESKSLEMSLLNYKEDSVASGKEMDAVLKYLDKLKPQCETKVMSYAERKAKREQEIEGLKEALAILEASS